MDKINLEVQQFIKQKEMLTSTVKEYSKKMLTQLEEMQFPELIRLMNDKYASVQRVQYPCEECGQLFDTKKGLGHHRKVHKK